MQDKAAGKLAPLRQRLDLAKRMGPDVEIIEAFQAYIRESAPVTADYIQDTRSTSAPEGMEQEHRAYVGALEEVLAATRAGAEELQGIDTLQEAGEILLSAVVPAQLRLQAACEDLQQALLAQTADVDLRCDAWSTSFGLT